MRHSTSSGAPYEADQGGGYGTVAPAVAYLFDPAPDIFAHQGVSAFGAAPLQSAQIGIAATGASAQTQTAATNAATLPSWVTHLSTASIVTDMSAAIVNGAVTYSGMLKLLNGLDATLVASKTGLTAAEFTDLKTIAANLQNGVSTSSYLISITDSLILGNALNATWTGGGAAAAKLGNLAAGSSATQLSELTNKWFLGSDLPSSKVSMGGTSFSVSYSASSKPVFGASGPSCNDINQGYLGDCYLLSSLAEVAYKNSSIISSMFTSNGNNSYGVRFYINGAPQYVTVNTSLANGGSIFNNGADIWGSLAEKAYAQLQTSNSWTAIGNGGWVDVALEAITGSATITDFYGSRGSWSSATYNSSLTLKSQTSGISTASLLSTLATALAKGDDVVLSSWTNATDSAGKQTLVAGHAMSIYGIDSANSMLMIRNPWGTKPGQYWDTTFEVSLSTLLAAGDEITVDSVGKGSALVTASAPKLTAQTASQTFKSGQAVNFSLASNTFTDPQGQKLTYTATQANGAALPSWLSFNAVTENFSGVAPATADGFNIIVKATNTSGLSASETFSLAKKSGFGAAGVAGLAAMAFSPEAGAALGGTAGGLSHFGQDSHGAAPAVPSLAPPAWKL